MVKRTAFRGIWAAALGLVLHVACGGQAAHSAPGGETNWMTTCRTHADCSGAATCVCGVCTESCSSNAQCGSVPGGACALAASPAFATACAADSNISGACFQRCGTDGCRGGLGCVDGLCVPSGVRDGGAGGANGAGGASGTNGTGGAKNIPDASTGATSNGASGGGSATGNADGNDVSDGSSDHCSVRQLVTGFAPTCVLQKCDGDVCHACTAPDDEPRSTGGKSLPCDDEGCNDSCERIDEQEIAGSIADGGTTTHSYAYSADACPSGTEGRWNMLAYDATTPGDSRIVLQLRFATSADAGGVSSGPPLTIATIGNRKGDGPDLCPLFGTGDTCPVRLVEDLGSIDVPQAFDLDVQLFASGNDVPALKWWEFRYSCIDPRFFATCNYGGRILEDANFASPGALTQMGCLECSDTAMIPFSPCVACDKPGDCSAGEFCDQSAACGALDLAPGRCRPIPTSCVDSDGPVCGCDGNTYASTCAAALASTGVAYPEACAAQHGCWNGEIVENGSKVCVCEKNTPTSCAVGPLP